MKACPILFSAPMIRALLDGRKVQTRRALKSQPLDILPMEGKHAGREWVILEQREPEPKGKVIRCRYGVPGDLLWVRETWSRRGEMQAAIYKADEDRAVGAYGAVRWTPSIHMPRWASRLTLRITGVRVERLQGISEEDAIAEGIENSVVPGHGRIGGTWKVYTNSKLSSLTARGSYQSLWESINGGDSWAANPWVWVICFGVVKSNVDQVMREAA